MFTYGELAQEFLETEDFASWDWKDANFSKVLRPAGF